MLYHLFHALTPQFTLLNVFNYITFRTALATLTALVLSFALGPWTIRRLRAMAVGQVIRPEGPSGHVGKAGTPTMGGLLILIAVLLPTLLWVDLGNPLIPVLLFSTVGFGLIGGADDLLKLRHAHHRGLGVRNKFLAQLVIASVVGLWLMHYAADGLFTTRLGLPFFKEFEPDLGWLYVPFVALVLVCAANGVNMTDGLDGLAMGAVLIAALPFTVIAYLAGNAIAAEYLLIMNIKGVGEATIFGGALIGASLGFLWFNFYPAEVFMGDTGSMSLGAAIGTLAILAKQELLLVIVGGLFVIETASVILQVGSFKLRGKRVFKMAPLHHHFELKGWTEPKIVIRFWILGIIFALMGLATLKLR
ncbi:MAG TPA: phospho-N-acetylmuramoyl-pentapeptide-transferase [Acidobacteriota bacterium]